MANVRKGWPKRNEITYPVNFEKVNLGGLQCETKESFWSGLSL